MNKHKSLIARIIFLLIVFFWGFELYLLDYDINTVIAIEHGESQQQIMKRIDKLAHQRDAWSMIYLITLIIVLSPELMRWDS